MSSLVLSLTASWGLILISSHATQLVSRRLKHHRHLNFGIRVLIKPLGGHQQTIAQSPTLRDWCTHHHRNQDRMKTYLNTVEEQLIYKPRGQLYHMRGCTVPLSPRTSSSLFPGMVHWIAVENIGISSHRLLFL